MNYTDRIYMFLMEVNSKILSDSAWKLTETELWEIAEAINWSIQQNEEKQRVDLYKAVEHKTLSP